MAAVKELEQVGVVGPEGGVAERGPNVVQQAILLWTFQLCAFGGRVRGVVGEEWETAEDPFAPIMRANFSKTTVHASPLWSVCVCVSMHVDTYVHAWLQCIGM